MLCIQIKNNDPYFCLAAEEYLLKNFSENIFMLWQSANTVVVGKHQNAMAEIHYPYVLRNNIRVARRISGGGAVFHDEGNVNFTYMIYKIFITDLLKSHFDLNFALYKNCTLNHHFL